MTKEELYNELKQDGAKLRAINFYKRETLQELYDERFGVLEPAEVEDEPEPEGESIPEEETPRERTYSREEPLPEPEPTPVEIHTLYFTGGGWCNETQSSYAPGYYRPATVEEYLALRRFAAKEL